MGDFCKEFHLWKLNWRNHICKRVYGSISDENRAINASVLVYKHRKKDIRIQAGIGNIFQSIPDRFRLATYLNLPDTIALL
jgi:hypothetical protein